MQGSYHGDGNCLFYEKALAAGVPKATILNYFYSEVTVEKISSY